MVKRNEEMDGRLKGRGASTYPYRQSGFGTTRRTGRLEALDLKLVRVLPTLWETLGPPTRWRWRWTLPEKASKPFPQPAMQGSSSG